MKQLTRTEIIELRAKAIDPQAFIGTEHEIHRYCSPIRVGVIQDKARAKAQATIETDEKAGVLMLVDGESEPEQGDIIERDNGFGEYYTYIGDLKTDLHDTYLIVDGEPIPDKATIIQRANTPVYQYAKEGK